MDYDISFFLSLRSKITEKLDNYEYIQKICNYNCIKNKRKVYSWQETDPIEKSLKNILNKLSDTNFQQIFTDIHRLFKVLSLETFQNENVNKEKIYEIQYYICHTLISRAIIDSKYLELYAKLCKNITLFDKDNLHNILIKVCESIFYYEIKKPSLSYFFKFLALLYNEGVITKDIMIYILNTLYTLDIYDKLCDVITLLDKDEFKFHYNQMIKLSQNKLLSNKIRFKIMDILEI